MFSRTIWCCWSGFVFISFRHSFCVSN
jgi:hypothetical protein